MQKTNYLSCLKINDRFLSFLFILFFFAFVCCSSQAAIYSVDDYNDLRSNLTASLYNAGDIIIVKNNGIAGRFTIKNRNSEIDNGGTIITDGGSFYAHRSFNGKIYVDWFGADNTGSSDATTAWRNAYQAAKNMGRSDHSTVYTYTKPRLIASEGEYLITGSITQATSYADSASGLIVEGENTVLNGGSGTFNFFEVRTGVNFKNIAFHGGGCAIYVQTGNSDSAKFSAEDCVFQNQTANCIASDSDSRSTIFNVVRSKFYLVNGELGGAYIFDMDIDHFNVNNCWIYYGGTGRAIKVNCTRANFKDILFVPNYLLQNNTQVCWFENYGSIDLQGNRFGGEGGGTVVVDNMGSYDNSGVETSVTAKSNFIYSANSVAFRFFELPTNIDISNNVGYELTPGIVEFDSTSISAQEIYESLSRGNFRIEDITSREWMIKGNSDCLSFFSASRSHNFGIPDVDDMIISANTNLGSETRVATSSGAVFYNYGDGRTGRRFIGSNQSLPIAFINPNGISEITSAVSVGDWITVVFHVTVLSNDGISGYAIANGDKKPLFLSKGDHFLNFRIRRMTDIDPNVKLTFRIESTGDIIFGPLRVFKGQYDIRQKQMELTGNSSPSSSSLRFFIGDKMYYNSPSAGGSIGSVCVSGSIPGTWKDWGSISQ